ncbi:MAG: class I SAM-dependent methyltransferase [Bdellovibrio sp.]|nr:class I SAM-dependent methyltransferase [Bdellovibrio sp.]
MNLDIFTDRYLALLNGPLKGLNLTRILNREDIFNKQVLDSVIPMRRSSKLSEIIGRHHLIVDVGFGGGFPLFPLAIEFSEERVIGIESIGKKVRACGQIKDSLGLANITLINNRVEKILIDRDALITFKAVGRIEDLLPFINVAQECDVSVLFYKGPSFSEELAFVNPSWSLSEIFEYKLPDQSNRATLLYHNVPRGTFSNKSLVKLSELILE